MNDEATFVCIEIDLNKFEHFTKLSISMFCFVVIIHTVYNLVQVTCLFQNSTDINTFPCKNFSRQHFEIFFYFSSQIGPDTDSFCMKCQILFFRKK